MKKKRLSQILVMMLLVPILCLSTTGVALAGWNWSCGDPVLEIAGHVVTVDVKTIPEGVELNGSSVRVIVTVPAGVEAEVLYQDPGITTKIVRSRKLNGDADSIPVEVAVLVHGKGFDVEVTVTVDGGEPQTVVGEAGKKVEIDLVL